MKTLRKTPILWALTGLLAACGNNSGPTPSANQPPEISVKLADVAVSVNGSKAVVKFKQTYSADTLNVTSRKTLDLVKSGDKWVIVRESTG